MPDTTTTQLQPDVNNPGSKLNAGAQKDNANVQPAPVKQLITPEEVMAIVQQGMEQAKFETQQAFVQALNAKAQQFSDQDPTVSTVLRAAAGAMNEAVMDVQPLGQNEQFNEQQNDRSVASQQDASQQQVKQSSDVAEVLWDAMVSQLTDIGYFEKNASHDQQKINDDLTDAFIVTGRGLEKFAEDNDIDFSDPNYQDLLIELVKDGTFYSIGSEENE